MTLATFSTSMTNAGFKVCGKCAYGTAEGYPVMITAINSNQIRITWNVHIVAKKEKKAFQKEIKKSLGRLSNSYSDDCLQVVVHADRDGGMEAFNAAVELVAKILNQFEVKPTDQCPFCGLDRCDSYARYKIWYSPVHEACVNEMSSNEKAKAVYAASSGSVFYGIIGALVGGMVGILLQILIVVITANFYTPLLIDPLFVITPICVYQGYEWLEGRKSRLVSVIVTIICSILFIYVAEIIYAAVLFIVDYSIEVFNFPVLVGLIIQNGEMWIEIIKAAALAFLFAFIGMMFWWNRMTRTVQDKIKTTQDILETLTPVKTTENDEYSDEETRAEEEYSRSVGIRTEEDDIIPKPVVQKPDEFEDEQEFYGTTDEIRSEMTNTISIDELFAPERDFSEEDAIDDTGDIRYL